jgi:y4mF family transcriptional regulator
MSKIEYPYFVPLPKYFGPAIKDARKMKGWTQKDLADVTATSVKFISNVEQGKSTAQIDKVFDLIRALGLKVYLTKQDNEK